MMKRMITAVLLLAILGFAACTQKGSAVEETKEPEPARLANPWRSVTEPEAKALCPNSFAAPEGAGNVRWSVMESAAGTSGVLGALVQLSFDLDGNSFTAREQLTGDKEADLSGMYYEWTAQTGGVLANWNGAACSCFRYVGENEWADLCAWYDVETGVSYSVGVTAKDLDGFDLQAVAEALSPSAGSSGTGYAPARRDGERFRATVVLEGMEEAVEYEHVRNEAAGFEMDYEWESMERRGGADSERFVSRWEDPGDPVNYLELTRSAENADDAAAAVSAALSDAFDTVVREAWTLEGSGACIRIGASGGKRDPYALQTVYIVPTADGCLVAAAHCTFESAEGFGARFSAMMNTLSLIA